MNDADYGDEDPSTDPFPIVGGYVRLYDYRSQQWVWWQVVKLEHNERYLARDPQHPGRTFSFKWSTDHASALRFFAKAQDPYFVPENYFHGGLSPLATSTLL